MSTQRNKRELMIPQWYAEANYDKDMTARMNYAMNALDPYALNKAYSFYNKRKHVQEGLLAAALVKEAQRQQDIKNKQMKKQLNNWRLHVKFLP